MDQLSALPDVRVRAMFGAQGIFAGEYFFAILDEGRLFFRTDEASQPEYTARGMGPFTYELDGREVAFQYHEVPPDVLEVSQELVAWAHKAIQVAINHKQAQRNPKATPRRTKSGRYTSTALAVGQCRSPPGW